MTFEQEQQIMATAALLGCGPIYYSPYTDECYTYNIPAMLPGGNKTGPARERSEISAGTPATCAREWLYLTHPEVKFPWE